MRRWIVRPIDEETGEEEGVDPYPTRTAAIEGALSDAEPGDFITAHLESCSGCSCKPEVLVVPERRVS